MDARKEVIAIISEYLVIKPEKIHLEADLKEDLGIDSLDIVEITLAIEDKFDIEIPDKDIPDIRTVDQIIKYVESKVIK
jgi:acyl carrier protein